MPLKLNVGASKKVGEANYGSRGASVNVEMELDSTLIGEPARLQEKIRQMFGLVRTSLTEELNGGNSHGPPPEPQAPAASVPAARSSNGNGNGQRGGMRLATPAQVKALYGIARQQGVDLGRLLQERCHVARPDEVTIRQASALIDELKSTSAQPAT